MQLIMTTALTPDQLQAVTALDSLIQSTEQVNNHFTFDNKLNAEPSLPCFYLGYDNGRLVAFLALFQPEKEEAELSAMTHPAWRQQGCFTALFQTAQEQMIAYGIHRVLLVVDRNSRTAPFVLKRHPTATFARSELTLRYTGPSPAPAPLPDGMELRTAKDLGKEALTVAMGAIYSRWDGLETYAANIVEDPQREAFLAAEGGTYTGICCLHDEEPGAYVYGLETAPAYRRQGIATALLSYAMEQGLQRRRKLLLDVDTENPGADRLYRRLGFETETQTDYYLKRLLPVG